jgi:hypothetical protein
MTLNLQTAKVKNYLLWLKKRGQVWPTLQKNLSHEQAPVKFLFIDDERASNPSGQELLKKIASAMNLRLEDYLVRTIAQIDLEKVLAHPPTAFVALGTDAGHLFSDSKLAATNAACLTIPHPLEMIANPDLKRAAWTKLQALMKSLDQHTKSAH